MKLRFSNMKSAVWLMLLLIVPLQMLATELGEVGKRIATLPGVSRVETLKSTQFPEKYVCFIQQQLDAKDATMGNF